MPWYVYIARLGDGRLYTGFTSDPPRRAREHESGKGCRTTRVFGFHEVLRIEEFQQESAARDRERQLKRWSAQKKRALIDGDMQALKKLVQRRNPKTKKP